jgi:hypothetical protein
MRYFISLLPLLACVPAFAQAEDPARFFENKVRPVLAEHCYSCHGPEKRKSDFRVDEPAAFFAGGSRGAAVKPGDAAGSLLIQSLNGTGELEMPPDGKLSQEQIDALTQWVAAGAVWPDFDPAAGAAKAGADPEAGRNHWAYQPVADSVAPDVQNAAWPRNEIDAFILARIESAGAQPAPEADRATLLRRVTYDLTGLPPSPEAVVRFMEDDSPFAYEKVVDRLLDAPQYGEHWARHWLDVVRYTDSFDSRASTVTDPAEIWRYRDWVVNSLNTDLPYDQFLRMQVAGDLMSAPDGGFNRDGLIATGVLAIGHWPQGDADKQKMVSDIVDEQVDLVTRAFMGVSLSCARCHDHKFDPFTTEDYYGLAGIFFSSSILPGPGAKTEGSPILHLPLASKEELAARAAREQRVNELRGQIDGLLNQDRDAYARREAARTRDYLLAALSRRTGQPVNPALDVAAVNAWESYTGERPATMESLARDLHGLPGLHGRNGRDGGPSAVINTTGMARHYLTIDHPDGALLVHPSPTLPARVAWRSPAAGNVSWKIKLVDADPTCGDGVAYRVYLRSPAGDTTLAEGVIDNGRLADVASSSPVELLVSQSIVLDVAPIGSHACDSTHVEWELSSDAGDAWNLRADVVPLFTEAGPWADAAGRPEVWWLEESNQPAPDPAVLAGFAEVLAANDVAVLTAYADALQARVNAGAAAVADAPEAAAYAALIGAAGPFWLPAPPVSPESPRPTLEAELAQLQANPLPALDLAVGIQEGGVPGTEHEGIHDVAVHKRGDYNNLGDIVPRRMPELLAPQQPTIGPDSGRLALAQWISEGKNPLTARVMVNRIWQHLFGAGIVRTPGDFGVRGEAPTHPELLDRLATSFMENAWHVKPLVREMVLSATYRQGTHGADALMASDPENRLFARMNRKRLTAEALRDSLLAATGELDLTPGGPAYKEFDTPRRTLYLRNVRSDRSTFTSLFDAADPTSIVPTRTEATIAPQALFLMNHPFVLARAEKLASAVAPELSNVSKLTETLSLRAYARPPEQGEAERTAAALGQLGADAPVLTTYCQALLSTNEFVFVD